MELSAILCLIVALIVIGIAYWYHKIPANLPPGPSGLPVLGSLLSMKPEAHLSFIEMAAKYGNTFHVYMGSKLVIVLNDFESIKEAFKDRAEDFSGRIQDEYMSFKKDSKEGIIFSNGAYWQDHRRFLVGNLRNNGVGKHTLEPLLLTEIQSCLAEMKKHVDKPFDYMHLLNSSMINNVFNLVIGERLDYNDLKFQKVIKYLLHLTAMVRPINLLLFIPWLKNIPGSAYLIKFKKQRKMEERQYSLIKDIIQASVNQNVSGSVDTYAQAYLNEKTKRMLSNPNDDTFSDSGLFLNSRDLFIAGGKTSSNTILWGLLFMAKNPQVQEKVQSEIDRVIGRQREPSYNDRNVTPYVEATIMEIHRMACLAPLGVGHRTTRSTQFRGFTVPKDTTILPNIYAVHYDPKYWGDPRNFRPERYFDSDGNLTRPEHLIPFGIGKRACPGEPLARMELYLYLVSILQHFNVFPPPNEEINLDGVYGIIKKPKLKLVLMKSR